MCMPSRHRETISHCRVSEGALIGTTALGQAVCALASSGQSPGVLLGIGLCTGQPHHGRGLSSPKCQLCQGSESLTKATAQESVEAKESVLVVG